MTFQRKLLFGASLMILPILLVGAEAIRSNTLERRALEALGQGLARTRTYAEVETAIFNQCEVVWRYLTGMDPEARAEFRLEGDVVNYWFARWRAELQPDEIELADRVEAIHTQIETVSDSIFRLYDAGHRDAAFRMARVELKGRLQPALTQMNREIYRRAREFSVQRAFARLEQVVETERLALVVILLIAVGGGLALSWFLARGLARPINELREAMAVVGAGNLEHPIDTRSQDEIGDLARAFSGMTGSLERTQGQLVRSEKLASIGEMAAAVAHGLRNPLASLRAAAQFVLLRPDSPAARDQLNAIVGEVDRLDRRITHLLTFSRVAPFHPMPERVPRLVEEILPAVQERMRERGVALELDFPADLPDVRVDPMRLEQVLLEIVGNALDAMPAGGRLRIAARPDPASDGRPAGVVVEITDTGVGIPEHVLPSVCEPFFTTRPEGTGLGLAIARRFVEQHGGRLELVSRPGAGTTVRVRLPLDPVVPPVESPA